MDTQYQFRLTVQTPNFEFKQAAFNVEAFVAEEAKWSPYDLCSDAMTAMIADGVTSLGAQRIDVEREKLAREIADALTAHIMKAIKSRDLRNGYPQA